jgi:hypothetical protein
VFPENSSVIQYFVVVAFLALARILIWCAGL